MLKKRKKNISTFIAKLSATEFSAELNAQLIEQRKKELKKNKIIIDADEYSRKMNPLAFNV